jgi:hypothetical protein
VYYGPALSGKTSNLQYIHAKTTPSLRGDLVTLKTRGDRTLFFDFLQLELGEVSGFKPHFSLYTVPGQSYYIESRKLVLQGADGVVFVADSQPQCMEANADAMKNLQDNLLGLGGDPTTLPFVLQCNKRDLPDALPVLLIQHELGCNDAPCFTSVATLGNGVFDTLKAIIKRVVGQAASIAAPRPTAAA